jgi:antitoxin (DNA-binding transcriptional repressor) of toxin-antitoxin stability system
MEQVGMRELRHRLREYLARAEAGEGFEVTIFGRPVAHLRPPAGEQPTLARLIAEGRVTPPLVPNTTPLPAPHPSTTGRSASAELLAERRSDRR